MTAKKSCEYGKLEHLLFSFYKSLDIVISQDMALGTAVLDSMKNLAIALYVGHRLTPICWENCES